MARCALPTTNIRESWVTGIYLRKEKTIKEMKRAKPITINPPLIPIEVLPPRTAFNAYSICTNLPEGLHAQAKATSNREKGEGREEGEEEEGGGGGG